MFHQSQSSLVGEFARRVTENVERVIVGKRSQVRLALVAVLAEGHVLMEDVPGVAKTMLARALAASLGVSFARVQCTPDLLPTDVTGTSIFNQKNADFEFRPGPVFHQVLLADEINRATPRTQSALLECMAERQVTVDGVTRSLPRPFLVIATQNPVEHEGTFPLPEAQLDRFLLRMALGYPSFEDENDLLLRLEKQHPIESLQKVATADELLQAQAEARTMFVHEAIRQYLVHLVHATRRSPDLVLGASPRASLALYRASQTVAAMNNRNYVLPDDIKWLAGPVLEHRVILNPESRLRRKTSAQVIREILDSVPVPAEKRE